MTDELRQFAHGWAVRDGNSIFIRTVSDTRRAAIINWLCTERFVVRQTDTDEQIETWWRCYGNPDISVIPVTVAATQEPAEWHYKDRWEYIHHLHDCPAIGRGDEHCTCGAIQFGEGVERLAAAQEQVARLDDETVERVAQAIWEATPNPFVGWNDLAEKWRKFARTQARAALRALSGDAP